MLVDSKVLMSHGLLVKLKVIKLSIDYSARKEVIKDGIRLPEITCYVCGQKFTEFLAFLDIYLCKEDASQLREELLGVKN